MVLTVGVPEKGCRFVSNLTMRSLLITSYNLFTLFYGPFTPLMNKLADTPAFRVGHLDFFLKHFNPKSYISFLFYFHTDIFGNRSTQFLIKSICNFMIIFQAKLKRFFGPYRTTLKIGESEILDHVAGVQYLPIGQ